MDIDKLTIGDLRELNCLIGKREDCSPSPYAVGKNYFIQTVTHYYTGKLVAVYPGELVLESAAWIPDTGRFNKAMKVGKSALDEVEPFVNPAIISRGAIVVATEWESGLPDEVK